MQRNDKTKPPNRPDCPREYHDDYIGRAVASFPALLVIGAILAVLGLAAGAFYLVR